MSDAFEHYARDRSRHGRELVGARLGEAGGAPCGDRVRLAISVRDGLVSDVGVEAEGCASARAAAAAVAELAEGVPVLEAAAVSAEEVESELGGLTVAGAHAAQLAADALHRAISGAIAHGDELVGAQSPTAGARPRVLVAISGGVDSAVAALLEREAEAEVVAVTLKLWADARNDGERSCCSPEAVLGARALAHSLGIPHLTMDLRDEFRAGVVEPYLDGHRRGTTPNPCVLCNGQVRIAAMVELADRLGAVGLATGHYARLADDGDGDGPLLVAPRDVAKDQTYMLSGLGPAELSRLRFPLAGLTKPRVREIAARAGLAVAGSAESQDLCFLAGEGKRAFLARHGGLGERRGEIVDRDGRRLGEHGGHHRFTVGQRRGIGIGGPEPLYVLGTEAASNRVVAGPREALAVRSVRVRDAVLRRRGERVDRVRLRYRSRPLACRLRPGLDPGRHGELTIELDEPAEGAAPGQTACLMSGEAIVGHATIA